MKYLLPLFLAVTCFGQSLNDPTFLASLSGGSSTTGCVYFAKAENNTLDTISGLAGSVTIGTIAYDAGKIGQAFDFSTGQQITVTTSPASTSSITVEGWTKFNGIGNGFIIGRHDDADSGGNWLFYCDTTLHFTPLLSLGWWYGIQSTASVPTGEWVHVAVTYDGESVGPVGRFKFYINGVDAGCNSPDTPDDSLGAGPWPIVSTTSPILIGEYGLGWGATPTGLFDEVAVYNRVLSPAEILSIYTAENAGHSVNRTP